jgi:hypothetical protein
MGGDPMAGKQADGQWHGAAGANAMMSRPYQMHVQEAQALGQQPMTPQQFAAQHGG